YLSEKLQRTALNLAVLRALNENVVESIPSGLITLSPAGVATFINPAGRAILEGDDAALFTEEEWHQVREQLATGSVVRNETEVNGRSIGYAVTPLKTIEGAAAGYTVIFQDLTEMKKLESELRLKDRMAAVGELSAGIAHEIRNPLAAIAGSVQVLKGSSSLSPQEQRLMSIVLKESERLNKSIADFLRFVRPQEKLSVQFDVAASLSETLELFANSPELREDHKIERAIEPQSFNLVGDADQIRQVFWNLARNAVQAMPTGGRLAV